MKFAKKLGLGKRHERIKDQEFKNENTFNQEMYLKINISENNQANYKKNGAEKYKEFTVLSKISSQYNPICPNSRPK